MVLRQAFIGFLVGCFMLQPLSRLFILLSYQANKAYIAQVFCVNKDDIALACEGRCYLAKQIAEDGTPEIPMIEKTHAEALFVGSVSAVKLVLPHVASRVTLPELCGFYLFSMPKGCSSPFFHPPSVV